MESERWVLECPLRDGVSSGNVSATEKVECGEGVRVNVEEDVLLLVEDPENCVAFNNEQCDSLLMDKDEEWRRSNKSLVDSSNGCGSSSSNGNRGVSILRSIQGDESLRVVYEVTKGSEDDRLTSPIGFPDEWPHAFTFEDSYGKLGFGSETDTKIRDKSRSMATTKPVVIRWHCSRAFDTAVQFAEQRKRDLSELKKKHELMVTQCSVSYVGRLLLDSIDEVTKKHGALQHCEEELANLNASEGVGKGGGKNTAAGKGGGGGGSSAVPVQLYKPLSRHVGCGLTTTTTNSGSFPGPVAVGCRTEQAMLIEHVIRGACGINAPPRQISNHHAGALGKYVAKGADKVDEFRRVLECLRRDGEWIRSQLFDEYGRDIQSAKHSLESDEVDLGTRMCDGLRGLFHPVTCDTMTMMMMGADGGGCDSVLPSYPAIRKFVTERQVNAISFLNANGSVYVPLHASDYEVVDGVSATDNALKVIATYRERLTPMHDHAYFRCGSLLDKYEVWLTMTMHLQRDYLKGVNEHKETLPPLEPKFTMFWLCVFDVPKTIDDNLKSIYSQLIASLCEEGCNRVLLNRELDQLMQCVDLWKCALWAWCTELSHTKWLQFRQRIVGGGTRHYAMCGVDVLSRMRKYDPRSEYLELRSQDAVRNRTSREGITWLSDGVFGDAACVQDNRFFDVTRGDTARWCALLYMNKIRSDKYGGGGFGNWCNMVEMMERLRRMGVFAVNNMMIGCETYTRINFPVGTEQYEDNMSHLRLTAKAWKDALWSMCVSDHKDLHPNGVEFVINGDNDDERAKGGEGGGGVGRGMYRHHRHHAPESTEPCKRMRSMPTTTRREEVAKK